MLPLSCSSFLCFLSYNKRVLLRQPNTKESSQEWSPVLPLRWVQFCPCLKASSSSPRTSPCSTHFNSSKAQAPWAVHRGKDAEAFPSRWLRSRKVFTRALFLCENLVSPGMMNEAKLLFVPQKRLDLAGPRNVTDVPRFAHAVELTEAEWQGYRTGKETNLVSYFKMHAYS